MNSTLGVVGAILTATAALVAIVAYLETPKGRLRATFEANTYVAAPAPQETGAPRGFKDTTMRERSIYMKLEGFSNPHPIAAFLDGVVRNRGSKDVKHVVLTVPEAVATCIQPVSKEWICESSNGPTTLITIGDLGPLQSVKVQLWLGAAPTKNLLRGLTVTHSEGVGRTTFDTVTVPGDRDKALLLALLFWLAFVAILGVIYDVNQKVAVH